jgi:AcrR family transcriptional regulator
MILDFSIVLRIMETREGDVVDYSPAEEKIIQATIDCIERYGLEQTTIRKIGEIANMNSASISYYFRSKDHLIERVLSASLNYAFRWSDFVFTEPMTLEDQMTEIFGFLSVRASQYPNLTKAHFHDVLWFGKTDTPTVRRINEFLDDLLREVKRKKPLADDTKCRLALIHIMSSTMLYFGTFAMMFDDFDHVDFASDEIRLAYVRQIVRQALSTLDE